MGKMTLKSLSDRIDKLEERNELHERTMVMLAEAIRTLAMALDGVIGGTHIKEVNDMIDKET